MKRRAPILFTSYEAASAAAISYRQLDYWTRIGLISATRAAHGSGSQRRFSHRDVLLLAAVAEVMRLGATTESAARLWLFLDGLDVGQWPSALVVTPDGVRPLEAGVSGWYVDVASAARQANIALLGSELEKVG